MRRARTTDDRGQPVTLYGSPLSFFRIGDTSIPPDVQRRISSYARKRRRGFRATAAALLVDTALVTGFMWGLHWSFNQSAISPPVAAIGVSIAFAIMSFVTLCLVWMYIRRAQIPVLISSFLSERRCPACGYDLADSTRSENGFTTCPECGAAWNVLGSHER